MNSLGKKLFFFLNNVPLRPASLSVVVALKTAAYSSRPKDRLKCSSIAGSLTPPTVLTPVLWPPAAADGVSDGVGVTAVSSIVVPGKQYIFTISSKIKYDIEHTPKMFDVAKKLLISQIINTKGY